MEFLGLFLALDLTTVGRSALIMYSMPVGIGLLAHVFIPGERATPMKAAGLGLAFAGTALAILSRSGADAGHASWIGDACALLAAWGWAGTAFMARTTRLREVGPEAQLFWMVLVSAPILLGGGACLRAADPGCHLDRLGAFGVSGGSRRGGRLYRLAVAVVGLSHIHGGKLFLPESGLCHLPWLFSPLVSRGRSGFWGPRRWCLAGSC